MKVFFDAEFTGLHQKTTLISIACVPENGTQFYAELEGYDLTQVDDWVKQNVWPHLWIQNPEIKVPSFIEVEYVVGFAPDVAAALGKWLRQWDRVEMWGDVLAYDWVLAPYKHLCHQPPQLLQFLVAEETHPTL
jgi:hypothetical protein